MIRSSSLVTLLLPILLVIIVSVQAGNKGEGKTGTDKNGQANSTESKLPFEPIQPEPVSVVQNQLTGEQIKWQVISSGGQIGGASTSYLLSGTTGQTATGAGSSESYGMSHGFWQVFVTAGGSCETAGDANHDGSCNVGDAVWIIAYVFKGGFPPLFMNEGDANNDCNVNVGDAVWIITYVFRNGTDPICGCVE
jgi:hypothetical protein